MQRVGLVYDPRFLEHETGFHPECPERLLWAVEKLGDMGLWDSCQLVAPRTATPEEVALFHDSRYIARVEAFSRAGGGLFCLDTAGSAGTYRAALLAVGGVLRAIEAACTGQFPSALCLVRPPGHHAGPALGKGFCFFNNVVIGALWARQRFALERVLILDWDVHHGDGTQDAFYADPGVLYFSWHQYPFYPYTGSWDECGTGAGLGYTVNVALPHGSTDEEYLLAFDRLLVPLANAYHPQLVLVSTGYDAHFADQLGDMDVTASGFWALSSRTKELAASLGAPLVMVLEGGYSRQGMGWGVAATVAALAGLPLSGQEPFGPESSGVRTEVEMQIERSREKFCQIWGKLFT
ncbi:MAG: histone deacetylase [Bacillota bacterium]